MGRPKKVKKHLTQWFKSPEWPRELAKIAMMPESTKNGHNEKGYTELAEAILTDMVKEARRKGTKIPKPLFGYWLDKMGLDAEGLLRQMEEGGVRDLVEA